MSLKTYALAAAAAALLAPALSHAATETKSIIVNVTADVPNSVGLQVSTDGWDGLPQKLPWDVARQTLSELTGRVINVRSPADIHAYLSASAQMASAGDVVDLVVKLDNVVVPATPSAKIMVADASKASAGQSLAFAIAPVVPDDGYKQGSYSGQFYMIFESDI